MSIKAIRIGEKGRSDETGMDVITRSPEGTRPQGRRRLNLQGYRLQFTSHPKGWSGGGYFRKKGSCGKREKMDKTEHSSDRKRKGSACEDPRGVCNEKTRNGVGKRDLIEER